MTHTQTSFSCQAVIYIYIFIHHLHTASFPLDLHDGTRCGYSVCVPIKLHFSYFKVDCGLTCQVSFMMMQFKTLSCQKLNCFQTIGILLPSLFSFLWVLQFYCVVFCCILLLSSSVINCCPCFWHFVPSPALSGHPRPGGHQLLLCPWQQRQPEDWHHPGWERQDRQKKHHGLHLVSFPPL